MPRRTETNNGLGQTLSQEITTKLTRRIVENVYPPESRLPTERELAEEFGVTRHVVREALKRLEAVGAIRIRQGSGIYVQDLQLTGGVELFDALLMRDDGSVNLPLLRDILEFRAHVVRTIVRLAALRRTEAELSLIESALKERRACGSDQERLATVNLQLFRRIVEATHNRVYSLMFNTLGRMSVRLGALVDIPLMGFEQTQVLMERVVEAFEHRDADMAELLITRHLETTVDRILAARAHEEG